MEKIRVNQGIRIGVNDYGDTILLDVNNTLFAERYVALLTGLDNVIESIDEDIELDDKERSEYLTSKMREVMAEIDKFFGDDACTKIFGEGVVPTPYAVLDFCEQLTPIIQKYADKRNKEIITKYKPRTGGK